MFRKAVSGLSNSMTDVYPPTMYLDAKAEGATLGSKRHGVALYLDTKPQMHNIICLLHNDTRWDSSNNKYHIISSNYL